MAAAKKVLGKVNIKSYTSAFEPSVPAPSDSEIEKVKGMMEELKPKIHDVNELHTKLCAFIPVRERTLQLVGEAIEFLNEKHRKVNIAKVTGSSVSLVGDGLVIGGAVAAPFTLGISLIATAVGGAVCAVGGATSAGAGLVELYISKKKVSEIQKAVEEDNRLCREIQRKWESIVGTCTTVSKKTSGTSSYSVEDVLSVLLVCCIPNKILDQVVSKAPMNGLREVYHDRELHKKRKEDYKETGAHAMDVVGGIGSGGKSIATAGRATAGVVVTALVVKFANKGSTAVCHCAKMGGVSRKVVTAAKVFRIATGINPAVSIALCAAGGFIDIASLIFGAYQIHKKSDSSAGKELIKKRDELVESKKQLVNLKECLHDVIRSV